MAHKKQSFFKTALCCIVLALQILPIAAAQRKKKITIGYSGGVWIEKYFDQVIANLEKTMPDIQIKKVVYPTYDDLLNNLPTQVAAKTNPDILFWTNEQLGEYAKNGVLEPLERSISGSSIDPSSFYSGLVEGWSLNGHLYGIPFNGQNSALIVNTDLLKKAGISDVPKSTEEMRKDAMLISEKTSATGIVLLDNLFHISQYVYAFGGGWGNGKSIDSPQNVAALQYLVDMFVHDKTASTAKQLGAGWDGEAFAKGTVAFSTGGPWYTGYMQQAAPDVHYKMIPIPTVEGGTTMVTYGGGLSIFSDAHYKKDAIRIIAFLTNDENMKLMATSGLKYLPAKKKFMDLYIQNAPEFSALKDAFSKGRPLDYPSNMKEFGDDLVKGFEQMVFQPGQLTPQILLKNLQEKYGN